MLHASDVLVFNNTRVIPARFNLIKSTGGRVEALFVREPAAGEWIALLRNLGNSRSLTFEAERNISVTVKSVDDGGQCTLRIEPAEAATELLARVGRMPLPPYIHRDKSRDVRDAVDRERYQTVYADVGESVAAPTAGLHFTPQLLSELDAIGVERVTVALDVGMGTFKPVRSETLADHAMHRETYRIPASTATALNRAKRESRRIIAVGTTAARVLESQPDDRPIEARSDSTAIFIYPPYRWKWVSGMITNFHLPRSTLIAMIAALVGLDEQRRLYAEAIAKQYRFFSYGDAMLIE